jgi:sucrose-6-phosphate hydrolase SacC (GH32 family)
VEEVPRVPCRTRRTGPRAAQPPCFVRSSAEAQLRIFVDKSIVEVFANDGATVLTAQLFPSVGHDGIEFFSEKGTTRVPTAKVWRLESAWK